jgi:hypothetical protein
MRGVDLFPRQAPGDPWYRPLNYHHDRRSVMRTPIDHAALEFGGLSSAAPEPSAFAA